MVYRAGMWVLLPLLISGCSTAGQQVQQKDSQRLSMKDVYAQSAHDAAEDVSQFVQDKLTEQKTYGYVKPYLPVVQEPVVKKVWVPDHKSEDPDVMVGGHWVYLMVQGPQWFADTDVPGARVPVIVPTAPGEHK